MVVREERAGRMIGYTMRAYATDRPAGARYWPFPPTAGPPRGGPAFFSKGKAMDATADATIDLEAAYLRSGVGEILDELDRELVGLQPVKRRIREIAARLLIDRLRRSEGGGS